MIKRVYHGKIGTLGFGTGNKKSPVIIRVIGQKMARIIGLEAGKVKLEGYSPAWGEMYKAEERLIRSVFGDEIICLEHIGSTAIPHLRAKPIIDVLLVLNLDAQLASAMGLLEALGYQRGDFPKEEGEFYMKGKEGLHTHYLHLRQETHSWKKYIAFRDYLRTHPGVAMEYELLKDRLREEYHSMREYYTRGKDAFITGILAKIQ